MKYKKMRSKFKHEIPFDCYPYLSLSMVEIFMRFLTLKETDPIDIDIDRWLRIRMILLKLGFTFYDFRSISY